VKAAENTSTTTARSNDTKASAPFFQKEGQDTFFSAEKSKQQPFFQTKLTIGQPNDKYEQEADRTADKVVQRLSNNNHSTYQSNIVGIQTKSEDQEEINRKEDIEEENNLQRKSIFESKEDGNTSDVQTKPIAAPIIQQQTQHTEQEELQQKEEELSKTELDIEKKPIFESNTETPPEENTVQTKSSQENTASADLQSRLSGSKGGGQALSASTQESMGSAMGADFSGVKIHTGSDAIAMNQELGAQAFTNGSDIYFNEGKYDTSSTAGKHLLAHELTHTVQQGAAIQQKKMVKQSTKPKVQRGLLGWIKDKVSQGAEYVKKKLKQGLNWAAERTIPGYQLLNIVLGKNIITDKKEERTGVNLIRGYMRLHPVTGSILLNQLEQTESLTTAGKWVEERVAEFGINFNDISRRIGLMWEEMDIMSGVDYNIQIFKKYLGGIIGKFFAFSKVVYKKTKELRVEGALRLVGAHELLESLKKSPEAMKRVVENPKIIFKYFIDALKQGFQSFKDNFGIHFKNALFGWLFGKAAEMGVTMPKQMNIAGLFGLIAQILGLTYQYIRSLVVKALGPKGEKIVSKLEKTAEIIIDFYARGPIALWERVKNFLTNLKDMVFQKVTELVTGEIIKAAVGKLVSMLNPAGAIVQLALTIYRVVKYFIDWWDTIKEIANGILSTITKVALGSVGGAAKFVENLFGKAMKLIIAFLARIFGLGGIAEKVKVLIKKISDPVKEAMGNVVNWIVNMGSKLWGKLMGKGKEKNSDKDTKDGKIAPESFTMSGKSHTLTFERDEIMMESIKRKIITKLNKLNHEVIVDINHPKWKGNGDNIKNGSKGLREAAKTTKTTLTSAKQAKDQNKINKAKQSLGLLANNISKFANKYGLTDFENASDVKADYIADKVTVYFSVKKTFYDDNTAKKAGKSTGGLKEYERQLEGQQKGINSLTIDKWQSNRKKYLIQGRAPESSGEQKRQREKLKATTINRVYIEALDRGEEMDIEKATRIVEKEYAALHDPDQVAGGDSNMITSLGRMDINSSIGSQWKNKIHTVDVMVEKMFKKFNKDQRSKVKMNVELEIRKK